MAIAITRMELDAAGLRSAAADSKDSAASRRMLALALVLEGRLRTEAARAAGMDRQTLRDWVHRYNEQGLAGLHNKPNTGAPPRKLTGEQEAAVAEWVRRGPTLAEHKVVRWRLVDLRDGHHQAVFPGLCRASSGATSTSPVTGVPSGRRPRLT